MRCYVFWRGTFGMFPKFREIFNGTPATPLRKTAWGCRSLKSAVLASPKTSRCVKQVGKKHKKSQQPPRKRNSHKLNTDQTSRPLQWRNYSRRRMKMWISACKICLPNWPGATPSSPTSAKYRSFEVYQYDTKLFYVPKLQLRCQC